MMLQRCVTVRHAVGTSAERRHNVRVAAQVVVWRMFAVIALAGPVAIVAIDKLVTTPHFHDTTPVLVKTFAFQAFPQWAADHQWIACPQTIDDLSPYANSEAVDEWGTKLEMRCLIGTRLYVRSAGPDLRFDTGDDITSND